MECNNFTKNKTADKFHWNVFFFSHIKRGWRCEIRNAVDVSDYISTTQCSIPATTIQPFDRSFNGTVLFIFHSFSSSSSWSWVGGSIRSVSIPLHLEYCVRMRIGPSNTDRIGGIHCATCMLIRIGN